MEFLAGAGIAGLFVSAFLAATILPLSSEIVLGILLSQGGNPIIVIVWATAGNVLGSVVNYFLGFYGGDLVLHRVFGISEKELQKAEIRFGRYGVASLLFAWVPIIGDPLTFVAGILKIRFSLFLILVSVGKCLRYWVLTWTILKAM